MSGGIRLKLLKESIIPPNSLSESSRRETKTSADMCCVETSDRHRRLNIILPSEPRARKVLQLNRMKMWGDPRKDLVLVILGICTIYPYLFFAGIRPRDDRSTLTMRYTTKF